MSLEANDIVVYGAQDIAEVDGATHGGAINTDVRYVFDDADLANTLNEQINIVSTEAADDGVVVIYGRDSTGVIVSGVMTLDGTTPVNGDVTFERVLKIVSDGHVGNVTVSGNTSADILSIMESGLLQVRRPFYNVAADAAGGSERDFYEKVFIKNNNDTNALLDALITEVADPTTRLTFAVEDNVNGSESVATRLNTPPTDITEAFSDDDKNIPGNNLLPGSGIGVWLKLNLPAGTSATKSTYTLGVNGNST